MYLLFINPKFFKKRVQFFLGKNEMILVLKWEIKKNMLITIIIEEIHNKNSLY